MGCLAHCDLFVHNCTQRVQNEPVEYFESEDDANKELGSYKNDNPEKEFVVKSDPMDTEIDLLDKLYFSIVSCVQ